MAKLARAFGIRFNQKFFQGLLLILFAFFLILKPFEEFLVEYFVKVRGVELNTILYQVFPVWTYCLPLTQLIFGILSEAKIVGHKWVLFLGGVASIFSTIFAIFPTNKKKTYQDTYLILSQVCYSLYFASHASFFGIRYHIFEKNKIHLITSLTRFTMLFGHVVGNTFGQLIYSFGVDVVVLAFTNILGSFGCLFSSLFLLSPMSYIQNQPQQNNNLLGINNNEIGSEQKPRKREHQQQKIEFPHKQKKNRFNLKSKASSLTREISSIFKNYLNFRTLFYSVFQMFSYPIHSLVYTYIQVLCKGLDANSSDNYNGVALAISHACASIVSLIPLLKPTKFLLRVGGELMLISISSFASITLLFMGFIHYLHIQPFTKLIIVYISFSIYHASYEFLSTCSYAEIAYNLKNEKYTSVFSVNTILQVVIQLILLGATTEQNQIYVLLGVMLLSVTWVLGMMIIGNTIYKIVKVRKLLKKLDDDVERIKDMKKKSKNDNISTQQVHKEYVPIQ